MSDHKGLSLPEVDLSVPVLSDKDLADPHFALELGVDFVALSFVRHPDDAKAVRKVAKIEKPRMVAHLPEVVAAFDAVMLARGTWASRPPWNRAHWCKSRWFTWHGRPAGP